MTYSHCTSGVTRNAAGRVRAAAVAAVAVALAVAALTAGGGRGGGTAEAAAAVVGPAAARTIKAGAASTADGFVRTGSHRGDSGYNEDDAFGDKDSDSYGFGTRVSSYGDEAGGGGPGAYSESSAYDDRGRSRPEYSAWHFEEKDGKPTKRYVYDSRGRGADRLRHDPSAVQEAEASEYDSVEAYDDDGGDAGGTRAGYETEEAEPEYGNLYDSADAYNDADY